MLVSITPNLQKNLEHFAAFDMLLELKTMFSQQAQQELLKTVKAFHVCKQEHGQSVSLYVLKMKSYIDNLERFCHLGHTVNELQTMLKLHEKRLPKKDATPDVLAIKARKIQENNKNKKLQVAAKGKNHGNDKSKLAYASKANIPPPP
ncbi:hypothetical protein Tco_0524101 [Tanacetum coccineum]